MTAADDLEATIFAFLADVQGDDTTHRLVLSDFLLWVKRREVENDDSDNN